MKAARTNVLPFRADTLQLALRGKIVLSKDECIQLLAVVQRSLAYASNNITANFTMRELETMELLCQGKSNKEIAVALGIEVRTVKCHVTNMLQKTGCSNRLELYRVFLGHQNQPKLKETK